MMRILVIIICLQFSIRNINANPTLLPLYTAQDSVKIEMLLKECVNKKIERGKDMLFFARKFVGVPYGAKTLEVSDKERLVLNLDKLDCTTLVETVTALILTYREGKSNFKDFLNWLRLIRYKDGTPNDYTWRNHYFSSWIENAEKNGWVKEIGQKKNKSESLFTATKTLDIHYMSRHKHQYSALIAHPEFLSGIRRVEKQLTGKCIKYIPKNKTALSSEILNDVKNGDILAIVTAKDGLDVSHLGIAVWGKDGRLHLLNASSLRHRVVEETKSLYDYMQTQKTQLGIRVIRVL